MAKARARKKTKASKEDTGEKDLSEIVLPEMLPVLPAKDLVAFPSVMMSFYVGRQASINAIEAAMAQENLILVVSQKDQTIENPEANDLYKTGVVANIIRTLKIEDDRYKLLIQGLMRVKVRKFAEKGDCLFADVEAVLPQESSESSAEGAEMVNRIRANLEAMVDYQNLPDDMLMVIEEVEDPGMLADLILAHLKPDVGLAQSALEEFDPIKRLKIVESLLHEDLNKIVVQEQIRGKAETELTKGQREYYLREQMKQIKQELGEADEAGQDLVSLKKGLLAVKPPKIVMDEAMKQFRRLESMNPEASDAALIRTYIEWIIDLPWNKETKDRLDLKLTKQILDEDHYGLDKVKDRILEYLSVRKLNKDSHGPILCLVGPPGVGKTSLGRSIAKALKRTFHRISLGGMRDEAEIRGHRRTYVGALPGRVLQGMKMAGTINPVFVLDELDKVGADFRGDPAAALLEVLDPEQNREFSDHYLNVPYDLSNVMFIATANTTDTIPDALLDRLEVIRISGYTTIEKLNIAKRYLIPKQLKENGLNPKLISYDDDSVLFLIDRYTREAGVRNLDRELGSLLRKIAREYAEGRKDPFKISAEVVTKLLGPTKFDPEHLDREDAVGYVNGLAWTIYGGETMPIEVSVAPGKAGKLALTGQLGAVMQESAQAALFFARANAVAIGLDPEFYDKFDIHVHCPAGATPKDGPSAGVGIATALVSALSNRKVAREYAMTGEITLRGNVLPVGGIKEKALAALRYGIKKVIIPHENLKDLEDIPEDQRKEIQFIPVKHVSEVLKLALIGPPRSPIDQKGPHKTTRVTLDRTV